MPNRGKAIEEAFSKAGGRMSGHEHDRDAIIARAGRTRRPDGADRAHPTCGSYPPDRRPQNPTTRTAYHLISARAQHAMGSDPGVVFLALPIQLLGRHEQRPPRTSPCR